MSRDTAEVNCIFVHYVCAHTNVLFPSLRVMAQIKNCLLFSNVIVAVNMFHNEKLTARQCPSC